MRKHLAIFNKEAVERIFKGQKKIEMRFSKRKIAPFGVVSVGDVVFVKPTGGDIAGQFGVKKVIFIEGFSKNDLKSLNLEDFDEFDQKYLDSKVKVNFATIIYLDQIEQFITSPIRIQKRDLRGWMVI